METLGAIWTQVTKTYSVAVCIQQLEIYLSSMCRYFLGWDLICSGIFLDANGKLRKLNVSEVI
jgi:hypothetical protein